jgi:hypothetical protein
MDGGDTRLGVLSLASPGWFAANSTFLLAHYARVRVWVHSPLTPRYLPRQHHVSTSNKTLDISAAWLVESSDALEVRQ